MKWRVRDSILIIAFVVFAIWDYYFYNSIPEDLESFKFFFLNIEAGSYEIIQTFYFYISFKLEVLAACIVWFITCKHWWRFVIGVPFIIEIYKLISVLNVSTNKVDEIEFIQSLPFTLPLVLVIFYILWRDYQIRTGLHILKEVDLKIDGLIERKINQSQFKQMELELDQLIMAKVDLPESDYEIKLLNLKRRMESYNF